MDVVNKFCCGLDVHKETVVACLLVEAGTQIKSETRTFGTMTCDLMALSDWLSKADCKVVAMESTGIYWKPIFNILSERFEVILANARHLKSVPGRKTDVKDCEWIARLLRHGLIMGSFIPDQSLRELRDLTRNRAKLTHMRNSVANRIQKVLEDANIKLSSVATDVLGKSGLAMIEAIASGLKDPEMLAGLAKQRLRNKHDELVKALEGRVTDHHRFMLAEHVEHLKFLDSKIERITSVIEEKLRPFEEQVRLLDTIPGVDQIIAQIVIAEIGADMKQFPTAAHLAAWAGMCPGNNESAGKHKSTKRRDGNPWIRTALVQGAWAATRTRNTYFKGQYHRLAGRRGKKRSILAVAHSILTAVYHMLRDNATYCELGEDFFDRINSVHVKNYLVKRLESLGHKVTLEPLAKVA